MGPAGAVWCVDARTGDVRWKYPLPDTLLGSVACEGGRLYGGCRDGWLYCLSTEGKLLARYDARRPIFSSPTLGRQHVYFSTKDGRTLRGRRLNEDTYSVQIIDEQENLVSLAKSDVRILIVGTESKMPSYADRLTADELADVIAYLVSLKGL